jgi:helix-turn-helix protein
MPEPGTRPTDLCGAKPLRLSDTPAVFFTVVEAATFLRVSPVTLSRWRIEGRGPPYRKFGRRVVYARDDLLAWAREQSRSSTSDQG